MPYLAFDVDADYSELIRLQQEIAKTKNDIQNFRPGQAGASIDALNKRLAESTARYRQLAQAAIRSGADMEFGIKKNLSGIFTEVNRIQDLLTRPMMAVGGLSGVYGLGEFLTKITSIRGQFQQMNASIETMIGKRKGEKLNAELQEFAKISPLEFAPTVSTAQMMLGFGIDADKVPRYLQAIGDVAMGDTRNFHSLALAFSQMSAAGKLMGQDLMQMVNAGFQPLQIISEKTGKSIGTLKEEMSQGKISAEMVQQAFLDATSEGGKYYKMSETASKTIPGAIAKLNDSMGLMFNDMGANMESTLVGIIDATSTIVENIERIIPYLATAAAAFGIYKTSVMLSTFAAKQSVIDASKSIIDSFDAELAKVKEMQNAKLMEGYDDDIRKALEKGSIDHTYADTIQQGRLWQQEQQRIAENEKRIAEEAKKAYEAHLKDMQTKREASGRGLDSDLNDANFNGTISGDTAERLQSERDYAQAVIDSKEAALESANMQKAASDQLVDAAKQRVESAKELMEMAEAAGDADDKKAAAEEYLAAIEEQATATTNQQNAQEAVNTAERERNSAVAARQAVINQTAATAVIGETTATNANTAATNVNTAATNRGAIATALATAKDKALTIGKYALTAATNACSNAWKALKIAFATNPFGLIITALTTVIGLFMSWKSTTDEVSAEVERFGENAIKTKANVEVLYGVLASVSKESKVYKDALEELVKMAKEYGITIDEEKNKYEQLIANRERLIQLIIEEGRQRQLANQIASYQTDIDDASKSFVDSMAKSIGDESTGDAEKYADKFARIIQSTIEAKRGELSTMMAEYEKLEEEYNHELSNYIHGRSNSYEEKKTEYFNLRERIKELVGAEAEVFAEQVGVEKDFALDLDDTIKYVTGYFKDTFLAQKALEATLQEAQESKSTTDANAPHTEFSAAGMDVANLNKHFLEFKKQLEEVNKTEVKPKVDSSEVDGATQSTEEAKKGMENLDSSSATPTTDNSQVDATTESAMTAAGAMKTLDGTSAEPVIKTKWLDNFSKKINEAWIGLQKFLGVDNPQPLISSNGKEPQEDTGEEAKKGIDEVKAEYRNKVGNATTSNQMAEIRKGITALMGDLDQGGADWKYFDRLLKTLDKKDKSKNKSKSGEKTPQQIAYETRKQQLEDERHTAELLLEERNSQRELEIAQMEEGSEKEIATIRFNAEKKRQALLKEAEEEARALEKSDLQRWLMGGKNRKEYQYYARFTDEKLAEMREKYLRQAKERIGFNTQSALITNTETTDLQEVYRADFAAMRDYLKEYGSFQQQKLAIAEEYAEKIRNAHNKGEELTLTAQRDAELRGLEARALTSQIDWYSVFDNIGVIMRGQLEPLYKQLQEYVKSETFRKSGADNQQTVISAMEAIRNQLGSNESWRDLSSSLADYQAALNELRIATENDTAVSAENARLMANLDIADRNLTQARNSGLSEEQMKPFMDALAAANLELDNYSSTVATNNLAMQEAQNRVQSTGTMLSMSAKNVIKPVSQIYTFLNGAGLTQLAELWGAFDQLKGGIDGLKALKDAADASKELGEAAESASDAVAETAVQLPGFLGMIQEKFPEVFNQLNQATKNIGQEAAEGVTGVEKGMNEAGQAIAKVLPDELLEGLGKAGLIGQIIAAVLKILDILKDGIGTLISAVIDTIFNAVSGILDNLLSGKMFQQIGGSLYSGLTGLFKSVFTMGGLFDWIGNGDSDPRLERDIELLTATNEALRRAMENLADEMREAPIADIGAIYLQQKSDLEQSMNNTQEMMSRSGNAYSKGVLGIGGHHSSNHKINKAMSGAEWSRISKIVGRAIDSANDFWTLSAEEMNKVANQAPDLYAKIKSYADDGYKNAAQFMDEYIDFYKELEGLENARREALTDISFDSIKDEFKSTLLDMESDTEDFANNFEKMMQQAVINGLMNSKYNKKIKKWYEEFAKAMEDEDLDENDPLKGTLTAEEQANLKKGWDDIVNDAVTDRDNLRKAMGWDGSISQQSSSRALEGMSQDTGNAIEGRLTALQIAVESIRTNEAQHTLSLADMSNELLQIALEYSRFNVHQDNIERQLAKIYIELQTISENTGAIVKPIQTMQADIAEIKKNTKNL